MLPGALVVSLCSALDSPSTPSFRLLYMSLRPLDIKGQIEDIEYFIKTQKAVEDSPNKAEIQGGRMIIG